MASCLTPPPLIIYNRRNSVYYSSSCYWRQPMMLKMVAVKDRSAEFFFPPFFVRSTVEAIRMFERLMNDQNRSGALSEYDLVEILEFNDQTGSCDLYDISRVLANGSQFAQANGSA